MKTIILTIFLTIISTHLFAQEYRFFVSFKEKNATFSVEKPQEFLSKRAIKRRENQKIAISAQDLPVRAEYLRELEKYGAKVHYPSKWLNGAVISLNITQKDQIKGLSFVKNLEIIKKSPDYEEGTNKKSLKEPSKEISKEGTKESLKITENSEIDTLKRLKFDRTITYGNAINQVKMLETDQMHKQGFTGRGILIAVFDGGFGEVNEVNSLKHLFTNKKIIATYDVVRGNNDVFEDNPHGREVLSCIAAYEPTKIIGTAPEASFLLIRTEDVATETRLEEYNWLRAAEFADSCGTDIINSSVCYSFFDEIEMNYTIKDLNGKTAIISQAAEIATEKGIIVVVAAGNEGNNSWKHIAFPADAPSVLAVGAVNSRGDICRFSSTGTPISTQIKPDLVAQGQGVIVTHANNATTITQGTSYAAPLIAGFVACVWQAYPQLSAKEIREIIRKSANQADNPDKQYGWGVPSFMRILEKNPR